MENLTFEDPLFLTPKITLNKVRDSKNVWDFQLQQHSLNVSNLYVLQCQCQATHKHNKIPCIIVNDLQCNNCNQATKLLISFQSLMFHDDLSKKKLATCCTHIHIPPCKRCINCNTNLPCVVSDPFECNVSTGEFCFRVYIQNILNSFMKELQGYLTFFLILRSGMSLGSEYFYQSRKYN